MTRPTTLPAPWAELAAAYGGVVALAERLGVSYRTLERWGHGETRPSVLAVRELERLAKRKGVKWRVADG